VLGSSLSTKIRTLKGADGNGLPPATAFRDAEHQLLLSPHGQTTKNGVPSSVGEIAERKGFLRRKVVPGMGCFGFHGLQAYKARKTLKAVSHQFGRHYEYPSGSAKHTRTI
jgi:hypothetical protein